MNTKEFEIKESHMVEGISADFVWYESAAIRDAFSANLSRFEKVVSVMEARHKEHLKMLQTLMQENHDLKQKLKEKA